MVGERIERIKRYFRLGYYRKIKRKYTLYRLFVLFLCALLALSVWCAVTGRGSLTVAFVRMYPEGMPLFLLLGSILSIDAVLKVGEAVGICSFLIAWIYAALDKKELGVRYGELLRELYPDYHCFVLLHLTAFLVCIWMAKIGRMEPAVLALAIVLADNLLQWKTLQNLILFSERRQKIATDRWKRLLDESGAERARRKGKDEDLLVIIYNLADAVTFDVDSCYETMGQLLARAIAQYIDGLCCETPDEWARSFLEVSRIWGGVLEGRNRSGKDGNRNGRELLAIEILRENAWGAHRGLLPVGYLLWCYNSHMEQGVVNAESLTVIAKEFAVLIRHHFNRRAYPHSVPFYMESAFTLLVWMHFMCGTIGLDWELFKLSPTERPTEEDRMALQGFAQAVFTGEICERYLEQAMRQVFGGDRTGGRAGV